MKDKHQYTDRPDQSHDNAFKYSKAKLFGSGKGNELIEDEVKNNSDDQVGDKSTKHNLYF